MSSPTFPDTGEQVHIDVGWNAVTPGFFETLNIPIVLGREFAAGENGAEQVVIVNRTFVERYLRTRAPVNTVFLSGLDGQQPHRIVGVAGNTKTMTVGEEDRPQLYQALSQIESDRRRLQFVLRAQTTPALLVEPVRQALRRLDPDVGTEVATLYSSIGLAFLPSQLGAALMGSAGLLALVLAAIGLYGTMAYSVARRISEFGVRMALGATERDMMALVVGEALRLVAVGAGIGLVLALLTVRPLSIFVVDQVEPTDPITLAAVTIVLALTAVVASLGPARRASRVEAAAALRAE